MVVDTRAGRLRMSLLGAVALALFAALFARVWFLQIMSEQEFVQLSGRRRHHHSRGGRPHPDRAEICSGLRDRPNAGHEISRQKL